MTTATSIRLDTQLKEQLKELASQMGVSFSMLVQAGLRQIVRERKVELSADNLPVYEMNPEYEKELMNDPDSKEVAFIAYNEKDIKTFFKTL